MTHALIRTQSGDGLLLPDVPYNTPSAQGPSFTGTLAQDKALAQPGDSLHLTGGSKGGAKV